MKPDLEQMLEVAKRDVQTVTGDGAPTRRLTHGVQIKKLPTHVDERGSLMELFDPRWKWHPDPLIYAYCFTIRPGYAKGWSLHQQHQDRYVLLQGEMELVLYDPRKDSLTCGEVCKISLNEYDRCLINVPINVWHADHNRGSKDVLAVNFPTTPYEHANPDKYRLPLNTDLIPYSFGPGVKGC